LKPLALLLLLACASKQTPAVPRQDEAIRLVLDTYGAPEMESRIRVQWLACEGGTFETGWSVGRRPYAIKAGWLMLCEGRRPSETNLAHVIAHKLCEERRLGADPHFYRDHDHTIAWLWGAGGLVEKANRRLEEAGL